MVTSVNTKLIAASMIVLMSVGCSNRKVQRVDPEERIDLSGRWNDTDSKMTASAMIEADSYRTLVNQSPARK